MSFLSSIAGFQSADKINGRKNVIRVLRAVIRQQHHLDRQIRRKYRTYEILDQYREQLKARLKTLTVSQI